MTINSVYSIKHKGTDFVVSYPQFDAHKLAK